VLRESPEAPEALQARRRSRKFELSAACAEHGQNAFDEPVPRRDIEALHFYAELLARRVNGAVERPDVMCSTDRNVQWLSPVRIDDTDETCQLETQFLRQIILRRQTVCACDFLGNPLRILRIEGGGRPKDVRRRAARVPGSFAKETALPRVARYVRSEAVTSRSRQRTGESRE
jgi:hypothetical protein